MGLVGRMPQEKEVVMNKEWSERAFKRAFGSCVEIYSQAPQEHKCVYYLGMYGHRTLGRLSICLNIDKYLLSGDRRQINIMLKC